MGLFDSYSARNKKDDWRKNPRATKTRVVWNYMTPDEKKEICLKVKELI